MPITKFSRLVWAILWMALISPSFLTAQTAPLLSQTELDPYGLKRVWFHQLKLHSPKAKISHILLEGGQLLLTTSDAKLHVLDSETGEWLWSRTIGTQAIALSEPAANSRIVAVHNDLEVYLFNRKTGKQLLRIPLPEAAIAACEMSEHYLYVPLITKTFFIYALKEIREPQPLDEDEQTIPQFTETISDPELERIVQQFNDARRWLRAEDPEKEDEFFLDSTHRISATSATFGTLRTKPVLLSQFYFWMLDNEERPTQDVDSKTHQEFLTWATDEGFLYTMKISQLSEDKALMLYRVDSAGQTFSADRLTRDVQFNRPGSKALLARPSHSQIYPINELEMGLTASDIIVAGGRASYIFAIDARSGNICWQYPTRGQLLETIAVIGRDVYAPTANNILYAMDLDSGKLRWAVRNVKRFVAASPKRVYVLDRLGRLACLDRAAGTLIFTYNIRQFDHCLYNVETDQIFLLTNDGLVQCLRERPADTEGKDSLSVRHRVSSVEFAAFIKGEGLPKFWWVEEIEERKAREELETMKEFGKFEEDVDEPEESEEIEGWDEEPAVEQSLELEL